MEEIYFPHRTKGVLQYDPKIGTKHFDPHWCLINCDNQIINLYSWFLKNKLGIILEKNKLWNAHISVIKGEKPLFEEMWAINDGQEVEYWYSNIIRFDNGKHAWLDVFSPDMSKIRESIGLRPKCFFHLTLGRIR